MFRLFLINLLKSGYDFDQNGSIEDSYLPPRRLRNRRIFERFDLDHKHLSLMNDQDILLVRDLSEKGFSTEVSERGFKRLMVGDVYSCRLRYVGELYDTQACVRWKSKRFVGFELVKASANMKKFMKRLIKPIEIGSSLQKVDEKFIKEHDNEGMVWYQGVEETNLYLWFDELGEIKSWQLEGKENYIRWDPIGRISTGKIKKIQKIKHDLASQNLNLEEDENPDAELKQFATDVFMAISLSNREQLIESIMS